jgi:hypothetical protein
LNRIHPVAPTDGNVVGLNNGVGRDPQQRQASESRPLARADFMKTATQQ